jgi:hypothetical protein
VEERSRRIKEEDEGLLSVRLKAEERRLDLAAESQVGLGFGDWCLGFEGLGFRV